MLNKKNVTWNSFSFIFLAFSNFVSFTFQIKAYDTGTLGFFLLISSLFGLGNSLDLGFGLSTVKHISEFNKNNDNESIKKYLTTFSFVFLGLSLFISLVLSLYFHFFLSNSEVIANAALDAQIIFLSLAAAFIFKYISNFLKNILEGFSFYVELSKINIILGLLSIIIFSLVYFLKLDIYYLGFVTLLYNVLCFVILYCYLVFYKKVLHISFSSFSFTFLKTFFVFGINIQISNFFTSLIDPIVKFFLGQFLNLNYVTFYEMAKKIIDFTNGLIIAAQKGILNFISEENVSNNLKKLVNTNLSQYSRMANLYSILIYGILNPVICLLIFLWGKSNETVLIFLIFSLSYSLINFGSSLYQVLVVIKKGKYLITIQLINMFFVTIFTFITLLWFNNYLGLLSFYIATVVSLVLIFSILKKNFDFDYKKYINTTYFIQTIFLNIILIVQIGLLYCFMDYWLKILGVFFILYGIFFWNIIKICLYQFKNILKNPIS